MGNPAVVHAKVSEKLATLQKGLAGIQVLILQSRVRRSRVQNGTKLHCNKGVLDIRYWEHPYRGSDTGYGPVNSTQGTNTGTRNT